ncbi:hypothetical protein SAY87_004830 [Trapa incisa]|uniref:DUF569 domain-containing protein n=1 Tax=Trapa incisa TaxID=236973 RepID=A0AAN7JQH3_9MYRT|nr:hypothetical protein SAY87_004830 [Trapa incisa]
MEFFVKAKSIRLRSHHDKYLLAEDDKESVCQDRKGSIPQAKWEVEIVSGYDYVVRLKSCYGKYLTATNVPFLLGMTGKKVQQTTPKRLDSSIEWEPQREGKQYQVRLKTRYGNFLHGNGGLPPWRNSITHDRIHRHRHTGKDWLLWEIDMVEPRPELFGLPPPQPPQTVEAEPAPCSHMEEGKKKEEEEDSSSSISLIRGPISKNEHEDHRHLGSSMRAGRRVSYRVAAESGDFMEAEEATIIFSGNELEELVEMLEEETGMTDIIICSHWGGKLYPLRLQLPPNNAPMHVVLVPPSSRAAREVEVTGSPSKS